MTTVEIDLDLGAVIDDPDRWAAWLEYSDRRSALRFARDTRSRHVRLAREANTRADAALPGLAPGDRDAARRARPVGTVARTQSQGRAWCEYWGARAARASHLELALAAHAQIPVAAARLDVATRRLWTLLEDHPCC